LLNKIYLTWPEVESLVGNIVESIRNDNVTFDEMLVVARGGLIPAGLISKRLDIRNIVTASVLFNPNSTNDETFLQFPDESCLNDKKILIVDDVWNTGRTITNIKNKIIAANGKPVTAVLHYKPKNSIISNDAPDYVGEKVFDNWIMYPWDSNRLEHGIHRLK